MDGHGRGLSGGGHEHEPVAEEGTEGARPQPPPGLQPVRPLGDWPTRTRPPPRRARSAAPGLSSRRTRSPPTSGPPSRNAARWCRRSLGGWRRRIPAGAHPPRRLSRPVPGRRREGTRKRSSKALRRVSPMVTLVRMILSPSTSHVPDTPNGTSSHALRHSRASGNPGVAGRRGATPARATKSFLLGILSSIIPHGRWPRGNSAGAGQAVGTQQPATRAAKGAHGRTESSLRSRNREPAVLRIRGSLVSRR